MPSTAKAAIKTLLVAIPETAGSALYGMVDVLSAAGNIWQTLVSREPTYRLFDVKIISVDGKPFSCGNRIPVTPDMSVGSAPDADIVIVPEIWLGPEESMTGRHDKLIEWLRRQYRNGTKIYSACSGSVLLAETGLLDGCDATSHWGYENLFRKLYPKVKFRPDPNLAFADPAGRIVTAGGTTSWHDLALYIIARHASPDEAMRIAKVYLLKWHSEGQLPYAALIRRSPHADAVVRICEDWLSKHFRENDALEAAVTRSGLAVRTLKRRFKAATGHTLIEYLQNARIEHAKHLLESSTLPVDEISVQAGYEDASFFRRVFRRGTGLSPSQYRRMFQPVPPT